MAKHSSFKALLAVWCGFSLAASSAMAEVVSRDALESHIVSQIVEKGGYEAAAVSAARIFVPGMNSSAMHNIAQLVAIIPDERKVDVEKVEVDVAQKQFTASMRILASEQDAEIKGVVIQGAIEPMVEVPVLIRNTSKQTVIREDDITFLAVPERNIKSQHITDKSDLIGKQLSRRMTPNQPLSFRDVESQRLVIKGSMVEMVYRTPYMELKLTGQAMMDGTRGEVVSVKNMSSGKVVNAMVMEDGSLLVNYAPKVTQQVALSGNSPAPKE